MAKRQTRLIATTTTCTLLIVLICCHEIALVDGRHLKPGDCKKCSRRHRELNTLSAAKVGDHNRSARLVRAAETKTSKAEHVTDDFRPTTPGHSPGVGHSINN